MDQENNYEAINQKMIDYTEKHISNAFDQSSALLDAKADARLPESIFVGYFLKDIIEGTLSFEKQNEWLAISGHYTARVNIFDDKTGEILYVTPGLMNPNAVTALIDRSQNMDDIYRKVEQLNQIPAMARIAEYNGLANVAGNLLTNADAAKQAFINEWLTIYRRYNSDPVSTGGVTQDKPLLSEEVPIGFEEF